MSDCEDRRYSNYYSPRKCAAEIAMECVLNGKSDMWSGRLDEKGVDDGKDNRGV